MSNFSVVHMFILKIIVDSDEDFTLYLNGHLTFRHLYYILYNIFEYRWYRYVIITHNL